MRRDALTADLTRPQLTATLAESGFDVALAAGLPIPGPQGPQGPAGVDGVDGAPGPQGPAGADGIDGATGPQGPQGPAGVDGADGAQGPKGDTGAQGVPGPQGLPGADGDDGAAGAAGAPGPQGPKGDAGAQGVQGPAGVQGPQGAPALIQDEGVALPQRTTLNFVGAAVATDDAANGRTLVTVPAGFVDPLTTKGDLIARSTVTARLPIGANTQVLTVDTTQAAALKWAAPVPLTNKGDLCVFAAAVARHPVGANGQVLAADSAQVNGVKWAGGGLVLVEEKTAANSASLSFAASISAAFDEYMIELINVRPVTDEDNLWMRMSTNGGASYDAGNNYSWGHINWRSTTSLAAGGESALSKLQITDAGVDAGAASSSGVCGSLRLINPASAVMHKPVVGKVYAFGANGFNIGTECIGTYQVAAAVNAFQFLFGAGNVASGTIRVYGFTKG